MYIINNFSDNILVLNYFLACKLKNSSIIKKKSKYFYSNALLSTYM